MQAVEQELVSVIIPVYNESEGVAFLVNSLNDFFGNQNYKSEVIFVNDGSADDTVQKLKEANHQNYQAKIINLARNFGSHAALRAGILHSKGNLICFNYADLQDPLELVTIMKKQIEEGNDIVWAHRNSSKISFAEKTFSNTYAYLMKRFAFKNFPEKGFDIVMFNYKVRSEINKNIEANSSIFLQILGLGFRQSSISYNKRERQTGKSKWTFSKKIKLFIDSFVAFSYAPIRFVTIVGFMFFIFGILWTLYIVARQFFYTDLNPGWPALISVLMIGFGITNISLGIIAEYLWRTLDASRNRPVFIIDEIHEINTNSNA